MSIEITMPRLSDTMEQGTLVKWYVKEGDEVEPDTVLADIETDKATMEMPTYEAGTVAKILVQEGETVNVGEVVMVLAEEGESVDEVSSSAETAKIKKAKSEGGEEEDEGGGTATATKGRDKSEQRETDEYGEDDEGDEEGREESGEPVTTTGTAPAPSGMTTNGRGAAERSERITASPLARRLAEEHGIDLSSIHGSGPSGKIIKRDVMRLVESGGAEAPRERERGRAEEPGRREQRAAPSATVGSPKEEEGIVTLGTSVPLSNMRQTIAKRLVESSQSIPHYQVTTSIDMEPLLGLRQTLNEQLESQGVKLSVNDFIVRACAVAMYRHPMFNASWDGESIKVHKKVNVGVAISLPEERGGGLVVATIFDADKKGLRQLSSEIRSLAEKARGKGLSLDEMQGSTFTVSNLGMYDVEHFTAIINPPNSAILAVGSTMEKAVVREGDLAIGQIMNVTLSNDHRVIDGAMAARYLQTFKELLENPAGLLV